MKKVLFLVAALTVATFSGASAQSARKAAKEAKAAEAKASQEAKAADTKAAATPTLTAQPSTGAATSTTMQPVADKPQYSAQERAERKSRQYTRELGLNADQSAKLIPILLEQNLTMDPLREKVKVEGKTKETSAAMKAANQKADDAFQKVLTPDQFATMMKMREERKAAKMAEQAAAGK